jgi:hypothetical protein
VEPVEVLLRIIISRRWLINYLINISISSTEFTYAEYLLYFIVPILKSLDFYDIFQYFYIIYVYCVKSVTLRREPSEARFEFLYESDNNKFHTFLNYLSILFNRNTLCMKDYLLGILGKLYIIN